MSKKYILEVEDGSIVSVLYQDGTNASFRPNEDDFRKTGRNHFSEVSKLIDALRGEKE